MERFVFILTEEFLWVNEKIMNHVHNGAFNVCYQNLVLKAPLIYTQTNQYLSHLYWSLFTEVLKLTIMLTIQNKYLTALCSWFSGYQCDAVCMHIRCLSGTPEGLCILNTLKMLYSQLNLRVHSMLHCRSLALTWDKVQHCCLVNLDESSGDLLLCFPCKNNKMLLLTKTCFKISSRNATSVW